MEIIEYALQFERDGEAFYREQAGQMTDKNLADIFRFLAEEEQRHYRFLEDFSAGRDDRPRSDFLTNISNVFTRLRDNRAGFTMPRAAVADVLERALRIEDESIAFYRAALEKTAAPAAAGLFALLVRQEEAHYSLLSSLIEYYETPRLWMEQAEFNNLKDY